MKAKYWIALALSATALIGFLLLSRQTPLDPAALAARALNAPDAKDRANAAVQLCSLQEKDAASQLRRLAKESQDPGVLVPVLSGLAARLDGQARETCLERLDDPTEIVREAAIDGLVRVASIPAEEVDFKANAPENIRRAESARLRKQYGPLGPGVAAMMMKTSTADAPTPPSEVPAVPAPTAAPVPSVSPTPSAAPALEHDNPSIQMLVWMCRALAVLVLIAEAAGAISVILGAISSPAPARNATKADVSLEERLERVLDRNAPSLWTKIGFLVAGAMCIIALLTTAEMVQLAAQFVQYQRGR